MDVNGIGGAFIRARDPEALTTWYREHLGITHFSERVWEQQAGPTVFTFFPMKDDGTTQDGDYFPPEKMFMLNFRVKDLDAMRRKLEASGIEVLTNPDWDVPEIGRFARIHDPEGNPIELWEPAAQAAVT